MSFLKSIKFRKKLMLMGLIPLALIGVIIGTLSYIKADQVVKQSGRRILSDTINRIDISINVRTRLINSAMRTLTDSDPVREMARRYKSGMKGGFDTQEIGDLFSNTLLGPFAEIRDAYVLMGDKLIYSRDKDKEIKDAQALEELYDRARRYPGKVNWTDMTRAFIIGKGVAPEERIMIYEGITGTDGKVTGLIVVEMDPRTSGSAILTKQKILDNQTTFITDRSGNIIYSDNQVYDEWLARVFERYRSGQRSFSVELSEKEYYCASQYNGLTGWVSFTMLREDRMFPEAQKLRSYIIALVSISVLFASGFLLILSVAITKPLEELSNGMKQAQNQNFELQLKNDRADEIGELTDSFNFMVRRIRKLVKQVYQEKLAQKNAEIEALQAQINPHFLYNTLDSINWMLIERDEMDISAVVVALGKLMQYSMDSKTSMVPLSEEYRNVRDYLMIQKYRLEDRLEFKLGLESGLESFFVPKLILQPLAENAIDHGVVISGGKGAVEVTACREGEDICITVRDNGAGMSQEQLEKYRRLLQNDDEEHGSIGIKNVARRLQLHFNGQCRFRVDSRTDEGTEITLIVPAITEEDNQTR